MVENPKTMATKSKRLRGVMISWVMRLVIASAAAISKVLSPKYFISCFFMLMSFFDCSLYR